MQKNRYQQEQNIKMPASQANSTDFDPEEPQAVRKTLNLVRLLVGIAIVLVASAMLVGLIVWLKRDISSSLILVSGNIK